MWNGIVAMALPKQDGKKNFAIGLWQCHCRNKEVKKKNFGNCGNPIAENGKEKKKWFPKSWEELKKRCYVHNIFTTFSQ